MKGKLDFEQTEEVIENLKQADVNIDLVGLRIQETDVKPEEGAFGKDAQRRIATFGKLLNALKGTSFSFQ